MNSKKTLLVLILVALTLIIMIVPTTAAEKGKSPAGFRALNGQTARDFQVPADMKLVAQEGLARYGVAADRYRDNRRTTTSGRNKCVGTPDVVF